MSLTLGKAKTDALKYIREYSNNGVLISTQKNADYLLSMNTFANEAQMEIATIKHIPAVLYIAKAPVASQLENGFEAVQHLDEDIIYTAIGSKAYYFEVDNIADIYIEECVNEVWTALKTISNTDKGVFTAYKGLLTPSSNTNSVRIRFSGQYVYNLKNKALYAYQFPTDSDVPDFRPFVKYDLPSDFYNIVSIINETDPSAYLPIGQYFKENNKLVFNYNDKGNFIINYNRLPKVIDDTTDDSYEFEVSTEAVGLIPLYMGAQAIKDEDEDMSLTMMKEYNNKLSMLSNPTMYGTSQIENVYGGV